MRTFTYERATSAADAVGKALTEKGSKFVAGGTNLIDLMKLEIETPSHLIDVNGLGFDEIELTQAGGLRIGAMVSNTRLAADMRVRKDYGVLTRALLAGASGQLRKQGDHCRQSAPAHPLPLFLRHQHAMQQAQAGLGMRSDRRLFPPACGDRVERLVHRDPSFRHGHRYAGA
jgi:xanthine dehydrogenase YagS FAD-binding subunit